MSLPKQVNSDSATAATGPQTIGEQYRNARLVRKLTLDQIAEFTNIRKVFLEAIESNQFHQLPGGVYTIGFLKSYARIINLNHESIIEQFYGLEAYTPVKHVAVGKPKEFNMPETSPKLYVAVGVVILISIGFYLGFVKGDNMSVFSNIMNSLK